MRVSSFLAAMPVFVRRMAVAIALIAAAIAALVIAAIYALSAAHAALAAEIGPIQASLCLAGGMFLLALFLIAMVKHDVRNAKADLSAAAGYDIEEVRRRSLRFVRLATKVATLRWVPAGLRIFRAIPWRVALGAAFAIGAVALLWPHLRREFGRKPQPAAASARDVPFPDVANAAASTRP